MSHLLNFVSIINYECEINQFDFEWTVWMDDSWQMILIDGNLIVSEMGFLCKGEKWGMIKKMNEWEKNKWGKVLKIWRIKKLKFSYFNGFQ